MVTTNIIQRDITEMEKNAIQKGPHVPQDRKRFGKLEFVVSKSVRANHTYAEPNQKEPISQINRQTCFADTFNGTSILLVGFQKLLLPFWYSVYIHRFLLFSDSDWLQRLFYDWQHHCQAHFASNERKFD